MTREYGQFCGVARALELVGGRWTMLIVLELLSGPKRFTDLSRGLQGIPTNVLSSRLRELEDDGLVQRTLQPGRSGAVVYELTPYGREIEEPIIRLGLWGAKSLPPPTDEARFSCAALQLALRGVFDADAAEGRDLAVEVRLHHQQLNVCVRDGEVDFPPALPPGRHVVLETTPAAFASVFAGDVDLDAAIDEGELVVEGSKRDARRFFATFHLPPKRPAATG